MNKRRSFERGERERGRRETESEIERERERGTERVREHNDCVKSPVVLLLYFFFLLSLVSYALPSSVILPDSLSSLQTIHYMTTLFLTKIHELHLDLLQDE